MMNAVTTNPQSAIRNPQWSGPQSALLPLCLAGMDACWVFTVAWLFSQVVLSSVANFVVPPAFMLALLEMGGWGLMSYLLDRTELPQSAVRGIMAGVGLILSGAVAIALNPFNTASYSIIWILVLLFIGIISLVLWLLGGYRATERASYEDVYTNFRLGLAAISVAALLSTVLANKRINDLWTELGGVGLWFFVFGLAGLALGNREAVRRETGNTGMKAWGWMVAASVGGILLLGLLGQAFGGKDVISFLQGIVTDVLLVIAALIYGILVVVLWPFSLIGFDFGPYSPPKQPTPTPTLPKGFNLIEEEQKKWVAVGPIQIPIELQTLLMGIAALLIVAAVVYVMTRLLRRTRADRPQLEDEERIGFGSWSLFMAQVRVWINRLLARFRKTVPVAVIAEEDDLAALQGNPNMAGTLSVRQIYARLLKLAGLAGYPRATYQTPIEYLRFLTGALPNLHSELNDITSAYIEARYGPMPASPLAVQSATIAWKRAESVLAEKSEVRDQKSDGRSQIR